MTRGSEIPGKSRNRASHREDTVVTTTRLHELREARGLGASEIARHVGVSRQTIYAIEAGNYTPNTAVALQLARVLEVSVENLFSITADSSDRPLGNISRPAGGGIRPVLCRRISTHWSRWVAQDCRTCSTLPDVSIRSRRCYRGPKQGARHSSRHDGICVESK
jgi:DNA-binding XRE family transcriptional regulator